MGEQSAPQATSASAATFEIQWVRRGRRERHPRPLRSTIDLYRARIVPGCEKPSPQKMRALRRKLDVMLAEAGYPQNPDRRTFEDGNAVTDPWVPWDVLNRCRMRLYDEQGIDYRIVEALDG